MGLAGRRVAKQFEEEVFPGIANKLNETVGSTVAIEVDWSNIAADDERCHLFIENWPKVYFNPLQRAIENICCDDMGKEAFSEGIEKIKITNTRDVSYYGKCWSLEDKVLTIDHLPNNNTDQQNERAEALIELLGKSL